MVALSSLGQQIFPGPHSCLEMTPLVIWGQRSMLSFGVSSLKVAGVPLCVCVLIHVCTCMHECEWGSGRELSAWLCSGVWRGCLCSPQRVLAKASTPRPQGGRRPSGGLPVAVCTNFYLRPCGVGQLGTCRLWGQWKD